jgi:protein-disulfide isomerase
VSSERPTTKSERKEAARAQREASELAAAHAQARGRRLKILLGILAGVVVALVVVVLASGGGSDKKEPSAATGAAVAGTTESRALLAGIPQSGKTLGNPKAPVTLIEFADLQCPYCKQFSLQTLPLVVRDYVRTGKVKVELHLLTFLGPDSVRGAQVASRTADQDKMWNFVDLFYYNQGDEQTGYATDAYLKRLAAAVPGLNTAKVFAQPITSIPTAENKAADLLAGTYKIDGTPSFVVRRAGENGKLVNGFDLASITAALDAALAL